MSSQVLTPADAGGAPMHTFIVNRKVHPSPNSLSKRVVPRINSASCLAMARPRPVPPNLRVVVASAWAKRWNSRSCASRLMPIPVSRTDTCNWTPCLSEEDIEHAQHTVHGCTDFMAHGGQELSFGDRRGLRGYALTFNSSSCNFCLSMFCSRPRARTGWPSSFVSVFATTRVQHDRPSRSVTRSSMSNGAPASRCWRHIAPYAHNVERMQKTLPKVGVMIGRFRARPHKNGHIGG